MGHGKQHSKGIARVIVAWEIAMWVWHMVSWCIVAPAPLKYQLSAVCTLAEIFFALLRPICYCCSWYVMHVCLSTVGVPDMMQIQGTEVLCALCKSLVQSLRPHFYLRLWKNTNFHLCETFFLILLLNCTCNFCRLKPVHKTQILLRQKPCSCNRVFENHPETPLGDTRDDLMSRITALVANGWVAACMQCAAQGM